MHAPRRDEGEGELAAEGPLNANVVGHEREPAIDAGNQRRADIGGVDIGDTELTECP